VKLGRLPSFGELQASRYVHMDPDWTGQAKGRAGSLLNHTAPQNCPSL
jgi:hypothetical protein